MMTSTSCPMSCSRISCPSLPLAAQEPKMYRDTWSRALLFVGGPRARELTGASQHENGASRGFASLVSWLPDPVGEAPAKAMASAFFSLIDSIGETFEGVVENVPFLPLCLWGASFS